MALDTQEDLDAVWRQVVVRCNENTKLFPSEEKVLGTMEYRRPREQNPAAREQRHIDES